jgi:hypothetical protein
MEDIIQVDGQASTGYSQVGWIGVILILFPSWSALLSPTRATTSGPRSRVNLSIDGLPLHETSNRKNFLIRDKRSRCSITTG